MRKIFLFFIIISIIVSFTNCTTYTSSYEFSNAETEIKEIDIVFLTKNNGNVEAEILAEIPTEKNAEFLSSFKDIGFTKMYIGDRVWLESGEAIRVIYTNGDVEYISSYGQLFIPALDGKYYTGMHASCDEEELYKIISKYYTKLTETTNDENS